MAQYPLKIALGPKGNGYIDPLIPELFIPNNRNLSFGVPAGAPLDNIKRAVAKGVLVVVEGSLEDKVEEAVEQSEEVVENSDPVVETEEVVETEAEEVVEEAERCTEKTKSGRRCKNNALPGEEKCGLHLDK